MEILHLCGGGARYENLTYGTHAGDKDGSFERVMIICRKMNIMPKTMDLISVAKDAKVCRWNEELSRSDRHILNIVRGSVFGMCQGV